MPKVAFVLATLLAAEGAVFAHPIIDARGYGSPGIIPRAVPGKIQSRALDAITLDFAPWSLTHYLYNGIVNSLEPTPGSQHPHVARHLSNQEDIKIRDYWEDENSLARRELDGGELDARDSDIVLVPRAGTGSSRRRRRRRRKPRRGPLRGPTKQAKVEHSPQEQHNAVAEKQEVTATATEHTGTPPEVPHNAGQETAGSGESKPGLIHKIFNHPLVHEGAKAGVRAATAVLNDYADKKGGTGGTSSPYEGGTRPADGGLGYE